jgi:hypothetical protein
VLHPAQEESSDHEFDELINESPDSTEEGEKGARFKGMSFLYSLFIYVKKNI